MRISNLVAVLAAPLLLGGAFLQESAVQETPSVVTCSPGIPAGTYVSTTDTYYFGRGDSPARIAESYGTPRWQAFLDLNPYLEGRISRNVTVGRNTYAAYADVKVCESIRGLQVLGLVPADLSGESAEVPVATLDPVTAEQADTGTNWWPLFFFGLLVLAVLVIMERQWLVRSSEELRTRLGDRDRQLAEERDQYQQQLAEERDLDFAARRAIMAPLPDGVEDSILAGPPVRFEGITPENRERELTAAATEAYMRLHPGANVNGITVERRNERRVLISSRPDETVEVSFGDGEPREVTLVREPGWMLDAIFRRNGEVVQELKGVCVLGFCANRICYTMRWLENCITEPYEHAAVHTIPDWGTVEQANRHLTFHPVDGQIAVVVEGEPHIVADWFELRTDGEGVRFQDGEILVGRDTLLIPRRTRAAELEPIASSTR